MSDDLDDMTDATEPLATPPASSDAPAVLTPPDFYVAELLMVCRCPTCGEPFAMRAELLGNSAASIHCPRGHAFAAADGSVGLKTSSIYARLRQANAEAEQLRTLLATLPKPQTSPTACDEAELARRVEYYIRSSNIDGSRFPCRVCGRHYLRRDALRRHIKAKHLDDFRRMPPTAFC